ncbi:MAG: GNAT family N-acetyltransferase [Thermomicrobiales bacterium]
MKVRAARLEDAPAIAAVHVRTWQDVYRGHMPDAFLDALTPERRRPFWDRMLAEAAPPWATFVAEDEAGTVVGFCSVGPSRAPDSLDGASRPSSETGEVYSIYVLPDRQGRGAGRMLLDAVCDALRENGFAEAVLWVLAGNAPAIGFYERMGWRPDGAAKQEDIGGTTIEERAYRRSLA